MINLGNLSDQLTKANYRQSRKRFQSTVDSAVGWQEGIDGLAPVIPYHHLVHKSRLYLLLFSFFCLALVLVGRLFYLQVIDGREYFVLSEQNRVYVKNVSAERGVIYDRDGNILARNAPAFSVGVIYSEIDEEKKEEIVVLLEEIFDDTEQSIREHLESALSQPYTQTTLVKNISHDQQIEFEAKKADLPGIFLIEDVVRTYPYASLYSSILGYTGEVSGEEIDVLGSEIYKPGSFIGRIGIEKQYEEQLRGEYGRAIVEIEASGKVKRETVVNEPGSGRDVHLTLNTQVQEFLHELMENGIEEFDSWGGTAIVSDVESGEIVSLVSLPTYDNNVFAENDRGKIQEVLTNPQSLLVNRGVSGVYSPGSTVKMAVGAMALEQGVISEWTQISGSPQVIEINGWTFPDWTYSWGRGPHGMMDLPAAIANSSDTFFYKVGGGYPPECKTQNVSCEYGGLGVDGVVSGLRSFGFGNRTGIDLPGEVAGLVPDAGWKEQVRNEPWFLGNTYHLSIGQGDLLSTPIQVLHATNIVATDAPTPTLHLIGEQDLVAENGLGKKYDKPVSLHSLGVARQGMVEGVTEGIVFGLRDAKVSVAAKTGTAEFGQLNAEGEYKTHAWVTGYAPVENPEISFVFMLEAGGKSSNAVELSRRFIDWYYGEKN